MSLHHISLDRISSPDIQALLDGRVSESKTCDYKHSLPPDSEEKWQDFLSDLTSFANADGGDIIFGIREGDGAEKGIAKEIVGLRDFVKDTWVSRAEAKMATNIHPRLTGVRFVEFAVDNKKLLLVRIPRSHMAPHATKLDKGHRFCTRGEQGKVELDVSGIRSSFIVSEGLSDRLRGFRIDRINKLIAGFIPFAGKGQPAPALVIHVLPYVAARPDFKLGVDELKRMQDHASIELLRNRITTHSYTFDGLTRHGNNGERLTLFRRGFFEVFNGDLVIDPGTPPSFPWLAWEGMILQKLRKWISALSDCGLDGPYLVSLSLLHVRGHTIRWYSGCVEDFATIDRDVLLTDEVEVHPNDTALHTTLKPIFDQIWNAFGQPESLSYEDNGNWNPGRWK